MAVLRQTVRLLRQSSSGVPSGVMVACVSWRAMGGRTAGVRALAFLPSQVLLPHQHCAWCVGERARGKIEWLCIQERWNPEVAIIHGTAACYRRATVGSSHDDVHPDNPALHMEAVRPHPGFVESLFFITPRTDTHTQVHEMLPYFRAFRGRALLRGVMHPYFQWAHWATRLGLIGELTQWAGSFGIP